MRISEIVWATNVPEEAVRATLSAFAEALLKEVGPAALHQGGAASTFSFSPQGASTEFWSYENAVAYTSAILEVIELLDPKVAEQARSVRVVTYHGGRMSPRTLEEASRSYGE